MENFQDYATATTSAGPFGITSMPAIAGSSLSLASPTTTAGLEIFPADLQAQITSAAVWASILDAPDSAKTAILEPFVDGLVSELEGATPSPTYLASMFLNPDPEYLEIASSAVSEFNSNLMAMASLAPSASQGVSGALQSYRSYAHDNADLLASYVEFAAEIQGLKSELAEEAFRRYRSATLFEEAVSFHQSATSFEEAVSSFQSTTSEASLVIETATVVSPIVVSATRTKVLGTTSPLLKPQGLKVSASSTFIPTATTTITSVVTNTITWTTAFVTTGPTLQERACASVEPYVSCTSLGLLYGSSMVTLTTRVPQRKPDAPENSTGQFEDMTEWISQLPGSVKQLFENDELSRLVILHKGDVDIEYNTGLQRIKAKREAETSTEDSSSDKSRECLSLYLACMREPSPVHSKPVPHHQMPPYHQRTNECHKKQLACLRGYSRFLQWKKPHSVHSGDMDKRDASPQNQRPQKPYPVFEDDKGGKVVIIDEGKVTLKINDWGLSSQGSGSA